MVDFQFILNQKSIVEQKARRCTHCIEPQKENEVKQNWFEIKYEYIVTTLCPLYLLSTIPYKSIRPYILKRLHTSKKFQVMNKRTSRTRYEGRKAHDNFGTARTYFSQGDTVVMLL